MDECDQVLKKDPNNLEAHELKAEALEHLGKNEEAKREFEAVYRLTHDKEVFE